MKLIRWQRKYLMQNILIAILLVALFVLLSVHAIPRETPVAVAPVEDEPAPPPPPVYELAPFEGRVEHIFFHPLIAYPERAFDGDYQAQGLDDYFVTAKEANALLDALYEKGFMLVDINKMFTVNEDGTLSQNAFLFPVNKKPLVISLDDVNYYEYMLEHGMVSKLVLDSKGEIATESVNLAGETEIRRDLEIIPIIDQFVKDHPDFSFEGAKGVVGLTGYEGILGYRTHADSPNRESEIEAVKPIINRLKETGWTFASHSYAHRNTPDLSYEVLLEDTRKWQAEVQSLIGPTPIYLYPYGSGLKVGDPRLSMLREHGFMMFCHVGVESYIKYTDSAIVLDRRHVDGIAFRQQRELNLDLYDADLIFDPVRDILFE
ncbi:MAG: polysaccharide deacetylase family protein [Clostridia bacterium]|nr:polysaccharide deacetylase family protein [Clostridia bacterium]